MNTRFDEKAELYAVHADIQATIADWGAEWLSSDVEGQTAIEFGAGTGLFTRHLEKQFLGEVLATDLSPRMVELGNECFDRINWKEMDAWEPNFPSKFDWVFSTSLLQWCEDPAKVLASWRSLVDEGSGFVGTIFVDGSLMEWETIAPGLSALIWRTQQEWIEVFNATGWKVERSECREDVSWFVTAVEAVHSWHDIGAVKAADEANVRPMLKSLRDYEKSFATDDGVPCTWNAMRIECVAI